LIDVIVAIYKQSYLDLFKLVVTLKAGSNGVFLYWKRGKYSAFFEMFRFFIVQISNRFVVDLWRISNLLT